MNYTTLRWWVIACALTVAAAIIQYKGLFSALWFADPSGLSFVTISIFFMLTIATGILTKRLSGSQPGTPVFDENIAYLQALWYASELLMALGMMGTLIGFIKMLGPALAGLDPANLVAAKSSILGMASGMSISVMNTLVGLVASQLIKLQLVNIEVSLPDQDDEKTA